MFETVGALERLAGSGQDFKTARAEQWLGNCIAGEVALWCMVGLYGVKSVVVLIHWNCRNSHAQPAQNIQSR